MGLRAVSIEEGIRISINERVGALLRHERLILGLSIDDAALGADIAPEALKSWETGEASPPAYLYFRLITRYGPEASTRAAELDMEMQFEKYQRHVEGIGWTVEKPKRKNPAQIWRSTAATALEA